jgi:hypothetical protein
MWKRFIKIATTISNIYPGFCRNCGEPVDVGWGYATKVGSYWYVYCKKCHKVLGLEEPKNNESRNRPLAEGEQGRFDFKENTQKEFPLQQKYTEKQIELGFHLELTEERKKLILEAIHELRTARYSTGKLGPVGFNRYDDETVNEILLNNRSPINWPNSIFRIMQQILKKYSKRQLRGNYRYIWNPTPEEENNEDPYNGT